MKGVCVPGGGGGGRGPKQRDGASHALGPSLLTRERDGDFPPGSPVPRTGSRYNNPHASPLGPPLDLSPYPLSSASSLTARRSTFSRLTLLYLIRLILLTPSGLLHRLRHHCQPTCTPQASATYKLDTTALPRTHQRGPAPNAHYRPNTILPESYKGIQKILTPATLLHPRSALICSPHNDQPPPLFHPHSNQYSTKNVRLIRVLQLSPLLAHNLRHH